MIYKDENLYFMRLQRSPDVTAPAPIHCMLLQANMSGYRMESGEDLVKFKENRTAVFPASAW